MRSITMESRTKYITVYGSHFTLDNITTEKVDEISSFGLEIFRGMKKNDFFISIMVGETETGEESDAPIDHEEFFRRLEAAGLEEPHYCHTVILTIDLE